MTAKTLTALLNKIVPTSSPPDWEAHDSRMAIAFADPEIRATSVCCTRAVLALVEKTAQRGFMVAALNQADDKGGAPPVVYLQETLAALNREIELADARNADEAARFKKRSDELMPLMQAAGAFSAGIAGERTKLVESILHADSTRHQNNLENMRTGLTEAELATLGRLEPSDQTVTKWRQRVETIDRWLVQLAAFGADPLHSPAHLAGVPVPGFDFARNAEETGCHHDK